MNVKYDSVTNTGSLSPDECTHGGDAVHHRTARFDHEQTTIDDLMTVHEHPRSSFTQRHHSTAIRTRSYTEDAYSGTSIVLGVTDLTDDRLDTLADLARNYGMDIAHHGRVNKDIGAVIVEIADELDAADQVIVGDRNRSPTGKALLGSTAQHVLVNADSPVYSKNA